ncbi:phosphotransferase [Pseudoalteromonas luteoviolacea]|uniref:phosphotransferase n=1 Tax=Pseudoalteromonas luteoviolacea TaxID=43657 RepID=UPI00163BDE8E|nr:phosphotransferase [Pseudoalteromonas luteoviolacea]
MANSELANIYEILHRLYPNQVVSNVRKLEKGLSNQNYYFEHAGVKKLLKLFSGPIPVGALQVQAQLAKQSQAQHVLHIDEQRKLIVLEYLTEKPGEVNISPELVRALVHIHQSKSPNNSELDLATHLKEAAIFLKQEHLAKSLITALTQWARDLRYCHNDLVKDNVIETELGIYFIDFEYAQYNDLYFDLAALCCSFSLTKIEQRVLLLSYYEAQNIALPYYGEDKLEVYIGCYLILSIAWYQQRQQTRHCEQLKEQFKLWLESHRRVLPRES